MREVLTMKLVFWSNFALLIVAKGSAALFPSVFTIELKSSSAPSLAINFVFSINALDPTFPAS